MMFDILSQIKNPFSKIDVRQQIEHSLCTISIAIPKEECDLTFLNEDGTFADEMVKPFLFKLTPITGSLKDYEIFPYLIQHVIDCDENDDYIVTILVTGDIPLSAMEPYQIIPSVRSENYKVYTYL